MAQEHWLGFKSSTENNHHNKIIKKQLHLCECCMSEG